MISYSYYTLLTQKTVYDTLSEFYAIFTFSIVKNESDEEPWALSIEVKIQVEIIKKLLKTHLVLLYIGVGWVGAGCTYFICLFFSNLPRLIQLNKLKANLLWKPINRDNFI